MKPGLKFAIGASIIVGAVGVMIYEGISQTGTYFLTPTQLIAHTRADPSFYDIGLKVSAKVVPGSIHRDPAAERVDFRVSDGVTSFPVTYVGLVPDTFTDANDIDVVVPGKLGRDGVFHATEVIAKCGSRYEAAVKDPSNRT
ncbi:MAG TPA: cytochrome c maturation protein CcmE [Gemmatimonadales bacterium]|jgi:cytochrome c-type biogenesis protein CcmE|nr:cytochrome c maturation protein CcmE [Gemmatimonadales bacterium]